MKTSTLPVKVMVSRGVRASVPAAGQDSGNSRSRRPTRQEIIACGGARRLARAGALLADVDPEGSHAAVEVAAIHAHQLGGARDVALGLGEARAGEVALVRLAGVAEGGEARGGGRRLLAPERREVCGRDALGRVHDDDAL